jgi:hypothetical protein
VLARRGVRSAARHAIHLQFDISANALEIRVQIVQSPNCIVMCQTIPSQSDKIASKLVRAMSGQRFIPLSATSLGEHAEIRPRRHQSVDEMRGAFSTVIHVTEMCDDVTFYGLKLSAHLVSSLVVSRHMPRYSIQDY